MDYERRVKFQVAFRLDQFINLPIAGFFQFVVLI